MTLPGAGASPMKHTFHPRYKFHGAIVIIALLVISMALFACQKSRENREDNTTAHKETKQVGNAEKTKAMARPGFPTGKGEEGRPLDSYLIGKYRIGGEFSLVNQNGKETSLSDMEGNVVLMAFGYTHCKDICPTTISTMGRALKSLKDKATQARMVFITVDPERDTPEKIKAYLAFFHPKIIGLTGPMGEIKRIVTNYQGVFRKLEKHTAEGYLVGHTGFYYLIGQKGKLQYMFPHDTPLGTLLQGLEKLIPAVS